MKKTLSIAAIALMIAGSYAHACSSCGCSSKGEEEGKAKKSCSSCSASQKA